MASVPTQEDFRDYLSQPSGGQNATPVVSLSGQGTAPVASSSAPPTQFQGSSAVATPNETQSNGQDSQVPSASEQSGEGSVAPSSLPQLQNFGTSGQISNRLLSPLSAGIQQTGEGIKQASSAFQQAAGPTGQTYGKRGGAQVVEDYLKGSFQNQAASDAARSGAQSFVNAQYTGPTEIDPTFASEARQRADEIQNRASSYRTGYGLQSGLLQGVPGLSGGEARYEAERTIARPEYRQEAREAELSSSALLSQLAKAEDRARQMAETRTMEEQAISERARSDVVGKRSKIEEDVNSRLMEAIKREQATEGAYSSFLESGDPLKLLGTEMRDFDPNAFNTPAAAQAEEARREFEAIMGKYGGLSEYDPLGLSVTKRGREQYSLGREGDEGFDENRPDWIHYAQANQEINKDQRAKLEARQKELETIFSPGTRNNPEAGKYAAVAPLYYGGGESFEDTIFQSEDPRAYTEYVPGVRPSVQNVSTAEQREAYNRINDLLDEAGRIDEAGEPYRASMIRAEVDRYLSEEEAALGERAGKLDERSESWQRQVNKARKKYRKAKSFGKFADIFKDITGSDTLGNALGTIAHGTTTGDFGEAFKGGVALPFAAGTYPASGPFNPLSETGDKMATSLSPAKAPRPYRATAASSETYEDQASPIAKELPLGPVAEQAQGLFTPRALESYVPMSESDARALRQAQQANTLGSAAQLAEERRKRGELII